MYAQAAVQSRTRVPRLRRFSLLFRRIHMYIGLFVTPWLAMYALSTVVFNHLDQINTAYEKVYGPNFDRFSPERELTYERIFSPASTPRAKAEVILQDLNLGGSFGVDDSGDRIVITRRDPFAPRRITYFPATHKVLIERQASRFATALTTLHTQVAYVNKLKRIKIWAASVDLTIAAMIVLVFSGFWIWWELKVTRLTGLLFAFAGLALFCMFLRLA